MCIYTSLLSRRQTRVGELCSSVVVDRAGRTAGEKEHRDIYVTGRQWAGLPEPTASFYLDA